MITASALHLGRSRPPDMRPPDGDIQHRPLSSSVATSAGDWSGSPLPSGRVLDGTPRTTTTPQGGIWPAPEASSDPFDSADVFDTPARKPTTVDPIKAALNITLAFGVLGDLLAGYAVGLSVFDVGITSVGLYGITLLTEYFVQVCCALSNRIEVDRIAARRAKQDCENGAASRGTSGLLHPDGDVSIAVVGYREDEQAWRHCLRSLQVQTLRPKCVIGVVDGHDEPDLSMANAFVSEFGSSKAPLIDLPILLSDLHRDTYFGNVPADPRCLLTKVCHWISGGARPGHAEALAVARRAVIDQVLEWDKRWNISSLKAVCFSQPHGHKRTAMFTAFAMSLWVLRTRDAVFTTDSDTLVQPNGLDEMLTLLHSSPDNGGVTADVKIWNRAEGLLTRLCAARYWFAFNIERACQSTWRCVGCLSGPMSMYRSCDLETILGPWNLQTFGGKPTTFGDDRHLTNQLLAHGLKTRYTHRTWCDSESPTAFVRWVAQQTRWSKSFFREAFWFPASFALQSPWMLLEMTIQTLYPFILIATVFHLLFGSSDNKWRPLIWLATMFGLAFVKCLVALAICWDPWILLFSIYGFIYFFGLLPSKIWALLTMNATGWGTSARSTAERKRGQSFRQRSFHVGHLAIWYLAIFLGLGWFLSRLTHEPILLSIGAVACLITVFLYWNPTRLASWTAKITRRMLVPQERPGYAQLPTDWSSRQSLLQKPPRCRLEAREKEALVRDMVRLDAESAASMLGSLFGLELPQKAARCA